MTLSMLSLVDQGCIGVWSHVRCADITDYSTRISIVRMIIQVYLLFEKPAHGAFQSVWPIKPLRRMEEDLKVDTTKDPDGWKQIEVTS